MKIQISQAADKQVGMVRLPKETYDKIEKLAKKKGVSKQEVIRSVLNAVIDEVELV